MKAICLLPSIEVLQRHQVDVTLACLLVSSVDASSVAQLNDVEGGLWEAYIQVLEQYLRPSSNAAPREVLIRLLETEVFAQLKYERQVTVCEVIIGVVAREPDAVSAAMCTCCGRYTDRGFNTASIWQETSIEYHQGDPTHC